jgi:squalene-associated FAD-dependent desaturase
MKLAIVGAGWAGMAAAVQACDDGHRVSVFEATRILGGRARGIDVQLPDGRDIRLDNGQHILIGAYTESLRMMRRVGVDPDTALQRLPLTLTFPDGAGLRLPDLPVPLDVLAGILRNGDWPLRDRLHLLRTAVGWKLAGFECDAHLSVAQLCAGLGARILHDLIGPLCVSALNTPPEQASAAVFLRVLRDALFGVRGGSRLLLPRADLTSLFPQPARLWLRQRSASVHTGRRVGRLQSTGSQWLIDDEPYDAVLLACPSTEAARLVDGAAAGLPYARTLQAWAGVAGALPFEAITTVYAWAPGAQLPLPMLALRHDAAQPAQFVFDRGQLGGPSGLLAFVVSASRGERDTLQAQVLLQARIQLGLELQAVQTVVEKRATFACTPGLLRPAQAIAPGLLACGDYVAGPYPATLEGAVRSAVAAVHALGDRSRRAPITM